MITGQIKVKDETPNEERVHALPISQAAIYIRET